MNESFEVQIQKILWDINLSPAEVYALLHGDETQVRGVTRNNIYRRLMTTFNWYTVKELVPAANYKELLSDEVLNSLYPPSIKKKYQLVRNVLFE